MKKLLVLLFVSFCSFGQEDSKNVIYKGFYNFSLPIYQPVASYKKAQTSEFVGLNSVGFNVSYLRNPKLKHGELSTIFIGGELAFVGNKQYDFLFQPTDNQYFMKHSEVGVNFKMRYIPDLIAKKILPFLEASVGPRFYSSKMFLMQGQSDYYKTFSTTASALNYNLEAGIEYKISKKEKRPFTYFDLGLGYSQSNQIKAIDKNRVGFDSFNKVIDTRKSVLPQNVYLKLGLTSYL